MGAVECVGCLGRGEDDDANGPKPVSAWHPASKKKSDKDAMMGHYISDKRSSILEDYSIDKSIALGQGTFGAVFQAKDKVTGISRAVKSIEQNTKFQIATFEREMNLMTKVAHPNIIKLFESYRDGAVVYLVMELCTGGELFDRIIDEQSTWAEKHSAILMRQILGAIYYLHREGIIHRDIKPENFLFLNRNPIETSVLKIIDFGLSRAVVPNEILRTKAGTAYYIAPQVLAGKYDVRADVWSCGVLMYIFLCGYPPFSGSDSEVFIRVKIGKFTFDPEHWDHVSEDAKELICKLMKYNPDERVTAEQALNDVWVRDMAPKSTNNALRTGACEQLRQFRAANKLKKAALHIIARQMSEEKIETLRNTFMAMDANSDGQLSIAELREGVSKVGVADPADFEELLKGVDADGSGTIDYTEFLASMLSQQQYLQEDMCLAAFRIFDVDGDGKITAQELEQVLKSQEMQEAGDIGVGVPADDYVALMKEVDSDGNGEIDFAEFMQMMRGRTY